MVTTHAGERGGVLIHVAIALAALLGIAALSVDFGVKWVARGQAQNAADAGALAGAVGVGLDNPTDFSDSGPGKQSALHYAQANAVWGGAPSVNVTTDVQILCPTCVDGSGTAHPCPDGSTDTCVRVDVYRNQGVDVAGSSRNPLPTFFARVVGVMEQGVKATATAKVLPGNSSNCLKPWAIPDKWIERYPTPGPWTPDSEFNLYEQQGNQNGPTFLENPDIYTPPGPDGRLGTGYTLEDDYGTDIVLKWGKPQDSTSPGWFFPVQLSAPGGNTYEFNIANCSGTTWGIGDLIPIEPGAMIGPTMHGMDDLIALDPNAHFNTTTGQIEGSCAGLTCAGSQSPRVVAIPVFDPVEYEMGRNQSGRTVALRIVNILGFFIDEIRGNDVHGYLVTTPALFNNGYGTVSGPSAFGVSILLVR